MKRALTKKTLYRGVSACALIAVCAGGVATTSAARAADIEAAGPSNTVQEIIITAERRNESAQDVPMTVQAFSGQTLQDNNIQTLDDLLKMTPNVTFANNGPGQGNIYMRGLGAGMAGNQSSATIGNFPNTAIYLDDQSMQFPSRNVDIYMVDMERVEVLEGPQGTLFGGGAEAGALRYITNKPKMNTWEARAEGSYGFTDGGANNNGENAMINIPLIKDRLAARVVLYNDRQGGYIDNAPSTFTRSNQDLGNYYFGVKPGANGLCPNGKAPGSTGCTLPGAPVANNYQLAQNDQNPVTNQGARISVLGQITDDWSMLVTETISDLDAEGLSVEYPTGSDFQQLKPMQVTSFTPSYDHDRYTNTAWTLTGDIDGWKAVYTGGFTSRHIDQQMDYTNYSRTGGGIYYQCTGGSGGLFGASSGTPTCYSPVGYWHDTVKNTHLTEEARVSTPDNWRIRGIGGWYWEQFRIDDVMNFNYKTIPDCTDANLAAAQAGGATCLADVRTAPGSTANDPGIRGANTAFGEDVQRGYDQNAFFGSVDFDVIPDVLTVTGGTRWYRYSEFELGSQYGTGSSCVNVPNGQCSGSMVNIDQAGDHKVYSGTRSRANLTWKIQPDILGYFTFSQGFRPGGFNRSVSNVAPLANKSEYQYTKPNSYAPDSLTNYEVGVKSELFDRRLQLNLSGYYMDWKNVQMNFYNPTALGNTSFGVNGPDYNIKGLEAQFIAKPLEGWTLQGSGSYNDATQTTSPCLFGNVAGSTTQGKCITQVYEAGVGLVSFQNPFGAVGTPPAFSPRIQGNMQLRYDWKVEDYKMFATVSGNYTGSMYNQLATYPSGENVAIPQTTLLRYLQPSYETMDASINLIHDNYQIGLFGTNLTNSQASMFTSSTQFIKSEVPIRPRVIGLKLSATF